MGQKRFYSLGIINIENENIDLLNINEVIEKFSTRVRIDVLSLNKCKYNNKSDKKSYKHDIKKFNQLYRLN